MKALVKSKSEPGLWLEDVPLPTMGINDVLIKVDRTGICGTDLHIYKWDASARKTIPVPLVVGHEFVGEIVEVGANVADFFPGDIVSGEGHVVCGRCRNCLAGRRHLCARHQRHRCQSARRFRRVSGAAHDQRLASSSVNRPGCGLDFRSVRQCGPHGPVVPRLGRGRAGYRGGPDRDHGGGRCPARRGPLRGRDRRQSLPPGTGQTHGCDLALDVRTESVADAQQQLGMQEGFDVGLEMSGNATAFRDMLANMCHGGKVAMLGIPEQEMAIDWNTVVFNMLTIKGIYGREMYETWYKMTVMLQSGLDLRPIITHRFHFTEYQKGFEVMKTGESGKVVLSWN